MYSVCTHCTLLKVVSYNDLSVLLSMSVMGFQKKVCIGLCALSSLFLNLFNFAKPLRSPESWQLCVPRIQFATVSKFGHFCSLHDAPVNSAV